MVIFKFKLQPRNDLMRIISCKKASIELRKTETLQVDGEVVGEVKRVDITILPKALKLIIAN